MWYMFVVCAAFGGTIMVCQTVLTLLGLAGESLHMDVPHDVGHDVGADLHADGDTGGDFHGDAGGDAHVEAVDAAHAAGHAEHGHGSTSLFKLLSFRAVVAAITFFGLAGLAAQSAELSPIVVLAVALAAALAAMYGVYWMMQLLYHLHSEGTVRIERAVGTAGSVYLRVPAARAGVGKVLLNLQNRTMEYAAMTAGPELRTGTPVVVVAVIGPGTLDVQAAPETEAALP
jgi:hypothetical protein